MHRGIGRGALGQQLNLTAERPADKHEEHRAAVVDNERGCVTHFVLRVILKCFHEEQVSRQVDGAPKHPKHARQGDRGLSHCSSKRSETHEEDCNANGDGLQFLEEEKMTEHDNQCEYTAKCAAKELTTILLLRLLPQA